MNILMVLSSHGYPPDRRVEREARDLIRDGHTVFLMARRCAGQAAAEEVDGVHVLRVPLLFQRAGPIGGLWYYFVHRYFILFRILSACRRHRIDALHVHDLPYALATVLAGRLLRIPVVFDMHENYPVMLESSWQAAVYRRMRFFAPMQLVPLRIDEYLACRRADKVVVVADEHIPRIRKLGATLEDILVVTNTEDVDYFDGLEIDESVVERFRDDFVILYVGGFGPQRGLDVAIRAMPSILESIPNARFVLVGSGIIQSELEALAEQLELGDRVTFEGHQPFERLPSYIWTSRVCLIPHISTPNVETGMPNKIFQFMILGRPIVISSIRPMMRVVDDARCGLVFEDRNPESLAEKVIELKDPALRRRLGENGRRAVERRYNWKTSVQPLLRVYREWNDARGAAYGK